MDAHTMNQYNEAESMSLLNSGKPCAIPCDAEAHNASDVYLSFLQSNNELGIVTFTARKRQKVVLSFLVNLMEAALSKPSIWCLRFENIHRLDNDTDWASFHACIQKYFFKGNPTKATVTKIALVNCSRNFVLTFFQEWVVLDGATSVTRLHMEGSDLDEPTIRAIAAWILKFKCQHVSFELVQIAKLLDLLVYPVENPSLKTLELQRHEEDTREQLHLDFMATCVRQSPSLQALVLSGWKWESEELDILTDAITQSQVRRLELQNAARNVDNSPQSWNALAAHLHEVKLGNFLFLSIDGNMFKQSLVANADNLREISISQGFLSIDNIVALLEHASTSPVLRRLSVHKETSHMHWNRTREPLSPLVVKTLHNLLESQPTGRHALQSVEFDCHSQVKMTWRKQTDQKWASSVLFLNVQAFIAFLMADLVISEHFCSSTARLSEGNIGDDEQDILAEKLKYNTSLQAITLQGSFSLFIRAHAKYCVKRNLIPTLTKKPPQLAAWTPLLEKLALDVKHLSLGNSLIFLAVREGVSHGIAKSEATK